MRIQTLLGNKELGSGYEHVTKCPLERTTITTGDTGMWAPASMAGHIVNPVGTSSIMESLLNYKLADLSPNSGSTTNGVRNPKQVSLSTAISYFYPWEVGPGRGVLRDPFRLEGANSDRGWNMLAGAQKQHVARSGIESDVGFTKAKPVRIKGLCFYTQEPILLWYMSRPL